jgi:hypothetical protein
MLARELMEPAAATNVASRIHFNIPPEPAHLPPAPPAAERSLPSPPVPFPRAVSFEEYCQRYRLEVVRRNRGTLFPPDFQCESNEPTFGEND